MSSDFPLFYEVQLFLFRVHASPKKSSTKKNVSNPAQKRHVGFCFAVIRNNFYIFISSPIKKKQNTTKKVVSDSDSDIFLQ
jgi:hypothetical protein